MIGIDTTVLVAFEIAEAPGHERVREHILHVSKLHRERFALAPQVLQEFLHVVTDPRRFEHPLSISDALIRSDFWWGAAEVTRCFPDEKATAHFHKWMEEFRLGRKRILDTSLAATYHASGVGRIATANAADFKVFDVFEFEPWAVP